VSELRDRLIEILELKELPRTGWLRVGVASPESVAAHSWGVAWLVLALCPEGVDRGRALGMAVLHDLAEVRVGDLTPHDGVDRVEKVAREQRALEELLSPVPGGGDLAALWREFEAGRSAEARFVLACDRLDMALQAARYSARDGVDTAEFVESALSVLQGTELQALAGSGDNLEI